MSDLKINFVERNGQTFLSLKRGRNQIRYFKYENNVPLDAYIHYYDDFIINDKIGSMLDYKKVFINQMPNSSLVAERYKDYVKSLYRSYPINKSFSRGITSVSIPNIHHMSRSAEIKHYKALFSPLVLNNNLLDVLVQPTNLSKLKSRFEFKLTLSGQEMTEQNTYTNNYVPFGYFSAIGNKTIHEVAGDVRSSVPLGFEFIKTSKRTSVTEMEKRGYSFIDMGQGDLRTVDTLLIFRKG